jgi:exopolyphosphatase/guanosine-5'-triphosphate,3'-diphosphate pyrophosphatase
VRLGAIDLGSNTIRLLVAEPDPASGLRVVHGEQRITRLGEGVAAGGRLGTAAIERSLSVIREYAERARVLGAPRIIVVATAAVRRATNRETLVGRVREEAQVDVRVVSGAEEARLTLLGVLWGLPGVPQPVCVLDIGGGSTELTVARGAAILGSVSLDLGVVSLAERFIREDPVSADQYAACVDHVRRRLAAEAWPVIRSLGPRGVVGTAGTVTTLAALDQGLPRYEASRVQGHHLTRRRLAALGDRLTALTSPERARLPCVEAGREDLIVPGVAVLTSVLDGLEADALLVSDTGLREGILLDAVGWAPPRPSSAPLSCSP